MTEPTDEKKGFFWALYTAWIFFDGKKTAIGATLIALAGYLEGIRMAIDSAGGDPWKLSVNLLTVTGAFIGSGGLIHQNYKLKSSGQTTEQSDLSSSK